MFYHSHGWLTIWQIWHKWRIWHTYSQSYMAHLLTILYGTPTHNCVYGTPTHNRLYRVLRSAASLAINTEYICIQSKALILGTSTFPEVLAYFYPWDAEKLMIKLNSMFQGNCIIRAFVYSIQFNLKSNYILCFCISNVFSFLVNLFILCLFSF